MAKFDIREFNYITSGKTQNTFNVSFCYTDDGMIRSTAKKPEELSALRTTTFFGDIGEYDSMSQKYATNKGSFYDINTKQIVHNLYELPKTKLKTTAVKFSSLSVSSEKMDIYMPQISDDFINLVQFENYAYGLTKLIDKNPVSLEAVLNDTENFGVTYHYMLSDDRQLTFTCPMPNEIMGTGYQTYQSVIDNAWQLSASVISTIFKAKRDLDGVKRNYIIEIPEGKVYNDYSKGYVQCDMAVAKNHLDYSYTLSVKDDRSFSMLSCREYCNIDVCGGQLYMTYRDNVSYNNPATAQAVVTYHDNLEADYDDTVKKYNLKFDKRAGSYTYQHIEVVDSWNRWDGSSGSGHKSSMFSLKLIDTGLNASTIPEKVKEKLRQNIVNNIRSIIDGITPANTQLFNVYFEGK